MPPRPVRRPLLGALESSVMDFLVARRRRGSQGSAQGARPGARHYAKYHPVDAEATVREGAAQPRQGEPRACLQAARVDLTERAGSEHLERLEQLVVERRRARERAK